MENLTVGMNSGIGTTRSMDPDALFQDSLDGPFNPVLNSVAGWLGLPAVVVCPIVSA